jgi:RHH-type proline utilization regulon transcriptional repressor/proline dehydrogenase/delta 1-pyrroline-5-carboxylate dehydrogenase
LAHPQTGRRGDLGLVMQAYLRDAEAVTEELLAWLAAHERPVTIRLVKGAYWDHEVAYAAQRNWSVPVFEDKAETDLMFERLTRRLLAAHPLVTTAVASHNVRSIAQAMAVADLLGLAKDAVEFQLLYGMGDALHAAILGRGYPVRIYTPIGALIPGMAYLVRRILENTSNESFLRQEFLKERSADELLKAPEVSSATQGPEDSQAVPRVWVGEPPLDLAKAAERDRLSRALEAVRNQFGRRYPVLLGDGPLDDSEPLVARNPSNPEAVIGYVAMASPTDAQRAVALAGKAQPQWAKTPAAERVRCLRRAAELMRTRRYELAAWTVFEVGKTWREADADVVEAIDFLEYYSDGMLELAKGKPLAQVAGEWNRYAYIPRGVAVVIAPWNFPIAILTGMASAALVTGNAVILKPAEQSSVVAAHVATILREAGIPPSVVQFLPGLGHEVGSALVQHPGTHVILFTGSKAVGLSIISTSAQVGSGQSFVKHVVTEMGGKNAILIDEDADLDAAVDGTIRSAFGYAGQKCSAASRVIVHEAVYERFVTRLVAAAERLRIGDPADPTADLGPLIDADAQRRLREAVAHAREVAQVAYTSPEARIPKQGYFVGPTILTDVPRRHSLAREELFGPLLCVFRVESFEEGIAVANLTEYALTGGLYSRSPLHIEHAARAVDVGNLYINRPITGAIVGRQPFGGHRLSGLGTKAGGPDYLLQLMVPKTITENTSRHGMPLE